MYCSSAKTAEDCCITASKFIINVSKPGDRASRKVE